MEGASLFLDGDTIDGLEFSIDTLLEILNEDPGPSQSHSPPGNQRFHHGNVACDQADPERSSQHQAGALESAEIPEDFRRLGFSPWESSNYMTIPDHKVERDLIGSSNSLDALYDPLPADNGNLHSSQFADLKNFYSYPSNYSYEWPSSSGQNSCFMDSIGGSFETFVPGNFDQQQFQNNIPISSALAESAEEVSLIHAQNSDFVNNFPFDSELEDFRKIEDSLHAMPMEKSGSSNALHNNLNKGIMPDAGVQEGNLPASLLVSSAINSDVTSAKADYAEVNPSDTTYAPCDPCNNSVLLPRGSATDMDRAVRQTLSGKCFQTFVSNSGKSVPHSIIEREDQQLASQKICRSNEVKLPTQKESLNSFLQEGSNLEASLLNKISTNANQHQDMSFKGESSTDSSSISSGRNSSTSDSIYKSAINKSKHFVHDVGTNMLNRMENVLLKEEGEDQVLVPHWKQYDISKGIGDVVHKNPSKNTLIVDDDDDDDDVCILNDISGPAHSFPPLVHIKPHPVSITQRSGLSDPHYAELVGMRLKSDDERLTFHIALQGLSEPKMEATPPDGVLAVPLLRHQRIALSWMVQKETASLNCSGGILADDQGLGKTVSTIALILMERSPSSISCSMMGKQEYEALNLDDDDEDADCEPKSLKLAWCDHPTVMDMPIKRENPSMVAKSRPAAGTLVVCPTSVIRQWAEELQNKVSSKANLSVLVYHGSNRTKDPHELAKYDVVLTTYAIVSMEVPKQPLVDEDDEDRVKAGASSLSMGHFLGKKRKKSSNSDEKNSKESTLPESAARPLAKVGWFRVILDEAQSIKNHRTQVARACWGLRAKRRWCLSGTPIQNAVDDLYSYFRFLRYDPYAIYKSFCSTIKAPISKNPTTGYRKLQAVLKTIMLRRTKGTLIDGKPIITLPPKFVTLKKVDFSLEERAFYSTLEAESREQFKEYAAAGTVKQNYVNILLMLLRLRQACDHPLLVKGYDSNATQRSSMVLAKKLPRDKQMYLLSCLEACLAICTICNDPPEDAVVTICGHVFCNQCISDHLTGDDNICPSGQCKFQLCSASVFSRGTLKSSPAGLTDHGGCSGDSSPEGLDEHKQHEDSISSGSSKIKAAIEILCSLPICHDPPSTSDFEKSNNVTKELLTNGDNTARVRCSQGIHDMKPSELNNGSTSQVTEKAIVFSQWTRMLDMLEVPLKDSSIQYRRLDGTMSVAARDKAVKDFNTRPEVTVMIMSLKAASLGLNMVAACHVLLLDLWWNPTTEDQAIDRAHRIGQTRPVTVSRLTVRDTVEDRILALQVLLFLEELTFFLFRVFLRVLCSVSLFYN